MYISFRKNLLQKNWNWVYCKIQILKKIIYNTMIVMNLAKVPGEASL